MIVPAPQFYKSRIEFYENIRELLYSKIHIEFSSNKDDNIIEYPIKYINDITGTINIPKYVKYVKIEKLQIYVDENFFNFIKQYQFIKGSYNIDYGIYNNYLKDDDFKIDENPIYTTYNVFSNSSGYSINVYRSIIISNAMNFCFI